MFCFDDDICWKDDVVWDLLLCMVTSLYFFFRRETDTLGSTFSPGQSEYGNSRLSSWCKCFNIQNGYRELNQCLRKHCKSEPKTIFWGINLVERNTSWCMNSKTFRISCFKAIYFESDWTTKTLWNFQEVFLGKVLDLFLIFFKKIPDLFIMFFFRRLFIVNTHGKCPSTRWILRVQSGSIVEREKISMCFVRKPNKWVKLLSNWAFPERNM